MQPTNVTAGSALNATYNYTAGSNNGKIGSATDAISGETVSYQYDSLNRLISASGSGWTQTQAYDGFGNLTGRTGTGTAQGTTISTPTNATTNQLSGYSYDANGNLISTGYAYDAENRISSVNAGALEYFYDAQNKRIWELPCQPSLCSTGNWAPQGQTINLFGADGKQLASYSLGDTVVNNQLTVTFGVLAVRSYFGGRLVGQQLGANIYEPVIQDRLGSVGKYYPYGEERNSPQLPNDQVKFATYTRDSATGNDYADQRYYTSTLGRFMTPDPYQASGEPSDPGSWNAYTYVRGDPINRFDPEGQDDCDPNEPDCRDPGDGGDSGGYLGPCGAGWTSDPFTSAPCSPAPCSNGSSFAPNPSPTCPGTPGPPPTSPPVPAQPTCDEQLTIEVYSFLEAQDPKLLAWDPNLATQLVIVGQDNGVDPRLIASIVTLESSHGSVLSGENNPFGLRDNTHFFNYGTPFAAVKADGTTLKHLIGYGDTSVAKLYSGLPGILGGNGFSQSPGYCQTSVAACQAAGITVSGFLTSFAGVPSVALPAGNPNRLGFPCP